MEFKTIINASKEKVWNTLWSDTTYPQWTAAFTEGSKAVTDWKKGSKVLFMDGHDTGIVSVIVENDPNEFMSFKHLGTIRQGVEDYEGEEAKTWSGAMENYLLRAADGGTQIDISLEGIEIPEQFKEYFLQAWPKALAKLKELSEN